MNAPTSAAAEHVPATSAPADSAGPAVAPDRGPVVPRDLTTVRLSGLRVRGWHGVRETEKKNGQDFVVDMVLDVDVPAAAKTDDLSATVDYDALAHQLAQTIAGPPYQLIETLADRLVGICLQDSRVIAAEITVHKPSAPISLDFQDVSVTIRRCRDE